MSRIPDAIRLAASLQIYAQKDLQKLAVSENDTSKLLTKAGLRAGSFDQRFPAMFSFHGLDIEDTLKQAIKDKDITPKAAEYARDGMYKAIEKLATDGRYQVLDMKTWKEIEKLLEDFSNILYSSGKVDERLSGPIVAELREKYENIQKIFKKPYIVAYSSEPGRLPSIKMLHNSFSNFRDIINKRIKAEVATILKENKVTNSKLNDSNYLTTTVLNWGHTRTGESLITGKLLASLITLSSAGVSNEAVNIISRDFIKETGQINTEIKMSRTSTSGKGSTEVLELVLQSEFVQKVAVQNRLYNQSILGQLEKTWDITGAFARNPELLKQFNATSVDQVLANLVFMKSSPSMVDNIVEKVFAGLTDKKYKPQKYTKTLSKKSTKTKVKTKQVTVVQKKVSLPSVRPAVFANSIVDLVSLQNLINANLADQIKKNMGDGNRRDVLNLRSGRLAESAQVERMSESRAGMITAFYSYMKNPYATFSDGGRQQYPRTRDPKLLISKSIREIAQQQVANRLRAVLV